MTDSHPDDQQPPASIWEPLDGSPPPKPPAPTRAPEGLPGADAWSAPHTPNLQKPPADQVAASYEAAQSSYKPQPGVYTLASWGARAAGIIIDNILFGAIVVGIALPIATSFGFTVEETVKFFETFKAPTGSEDTTPLYIILVGVLFCLGLLPALCLTLWNGQTPGKRIAGVRVMTGSGVPLTFAIAARRELLGRAVLLTVASYFSIGLALPLNYLWPLLDTQRRAGHDVFADTRVVQVTLR